MQKCKIVHDRTAAEDIYSQRIARSTFLIVPQIAFNGLPQKCERFQGYQRRQSVLVISAAPGRGGPA
jgi:hypothetical protein